METEPTLWRIFSYGEEFHPAGQPYWWKNKGRPGSTCVIQYTLAGALYHIGNEQENLVKKGQALLFTYEDGSEYGLRPRDKSYTCFWISLRGAGLEEHWSLIHERHGPIITDTNGELLNLLRESVKSGGFSDEKDPIHIALKTHQFVMLLMRLLDRHSLHLSTPAERALARMRNNPYYPWSIKELTEEAGCSREHFFRVFKEHYQTTPSVWLSQQRAAQARYLLLTTRLTVEDVALQCGFSGAHGLARTLRRIYQQSPKELRAPSI
jgi:AraC-like DNA-binding protein